MLDADGSIRDLSAMIPDITPATLEQLDRLRDILPSSLPRVEGNPRIGTPLSGIPKLVCVGLNYSDHAEETGQAKPAEPVLFMKAVTSVAGPYDDIVLPRGAEKTDWEVELGIVIGKRAQYVSRAEAASCIAGYVVVNDLSERAWQFERGGNWSKGKSADGFAPIGPYLVTADEVPDPQKLELFCEVNGQMMQQGTTENMIFDVMTIVSYISGFMTLMPGDVIPTGTPAGVGFGRKPKLFLKAGDRMRTGISGLGEQRQTLVAYEG